VKRAMAVLTLTLLVLVTGLTAQEKPKAAKTVKLPEVSAEDVAGYLAIDRDLTWAQQAFQVAAEALPQYRAFTEAQAAKQKKVADLFAKYKVPGDKYLCDGPGAAPCERVAVGRMAFEDPPRTEAKK
jgi:hypothetical protein